MFIIFEIYVIGVIAKLFKYKSRFLSDLLLSFEVVIHTFSKTLSLHIKNITSQYQKTVLRVSSFSCYIPSYFISPAMCSLKILDTFFLESKFSFLRKLYILLSLFFFDNLCFRHVVAQCVYSLLTLLFYILLHTIRFFV